MLLARRACIVLFAGRAPLHRKGDVYCADLLIRRPAALEGV